MNRKRFMGAFSLVETIIAAGVFALSVTAIIALMPLLARQGGAAADSLAAQRLPDALAIELTRLTSSGFDALAAKIPAMNSPLKGGMVFVANREASTLYSRDYLPPAAGQLAQGEHYFLVECWRFPDEPLRFDPAKGFLSLSVRVSWPYRLNGVPSPTEETSRSRILFTLALNR